jgi:hypothetical protein
LFDPANPANTWRLRDAVDFVFPPGVLLAPGGFALVVGFDPADPVAAAEFRSVNNVPGNVPLFGPWSGKLDNSSEGVELARPDVPEPGNGFVAYILADKVAYKDESPWDTNNVDGFGFSLHRIDPAAYGNDPANWRASVRTAGSGAPPTGGTAPQIVTQPSNVLSGERGTATFSVTATGSAPLSYQWLFNGVPLRAADSPSLTLTDLRLNDAGGYSCRVFNPAGEAVSDSGMLMIRMIPRITEYPLGRNVIIGPDARAAREPVVIEGETILVQRTNVTFSVDATTSFPPLSYQWNFNGVAIQGATEPSLTITNVQLENEGDYSCSVSDTAGTITTYSAPLGVWFGPIIVTTIPTATNVVTTGNSAYTNYVPVGSPITFGASIIGNPSPFSYILRLGSSIVTNFTTESRSVLYYQNVSPVPRTDTYRLIVTNVAQPFITIGQWTATFYVATLADDDGDGIPDEIEASFGLSTNNAADALGELDGDGLSNKAEYLAGTDLTNSMSSLRVDLAGTAGMAVVEVAAVADRSYTVQYTDDIATSAWKKLGDIYSGPTNRVEFIPDPLWTTNRFYRVVLPVQP